MLSRRFLLLSDRTCSVNSKQLTKATEHLLYLHSYFRFSTFFTTILSIYTVTIGWPLRFGFQ